MKSLKKRYTKNINKMIILLPRPTNNHKLSFIVFLKDFSAAVIYVIEDQATFDSYYKTTFLFDCVNQNNF